MKCEKTFFIRHIVLFQGLYGTRSEDLGEKPVKPAMGDLIAIQDDASAQGKDQQDGFQPILDGQHHHTDEDEQHGPQAPNEGPTEIEDVESGQKGDHADE